MAGGNDGRCGASFTNTYVRFETRVVKSHLTGIETFEVET